MDDFTQFQLKEYENISQAHFKTNEVLATFYRYFLLIAAIPITAIGIAMMRISDNGIAEEGRLLVYLIFGVSTLLLSLVGSAVIAYIEGLRLDAILYARTVNSIRDYFFKLPGAGAFGEPVLPTKKNKPSYSGFGSAFIIYFACATMNATYCSAGVLALMLDSSVTLTNIHITCTQWVIVGIVFTLMLLAQGIIRKQLLAAKKAKGF